MTDTQSGLEPHITNSTTARYGRPPIVEALVDLHIAFEGEPQLAAQSAMAGEGAEYSTPQPIVATTWRVSASATDLEAAEKALIGFRYDNKDAGRVVLVRFNGFTFSQQQPYPAAGWDAWTIEARRLWQRYAEAFNGAVISRIAVRYINRIVIEEGATHANHFLVGPLVPIEFGEYRNFLLRTELDVGKDIGATVLLTHGELQLEAGETGRAFLLDLDISCASSDNIASPFIWERLNQLHSLIGPIFEGSVTEPTKRIYR